MKMTKVFDIAFVAGILVWIVFAWVLPFLFNADNDITLWMVFLTFGLVIYGLGRVVIKFVQKLNN